MIFPLNDEKIGETLERLAKTKPFKNKYKWEGINVPSEKRCLANIEKK